MKNTILNNLTRSIVGTSLALILSLSGLATTEAAGRRNPGGGAPFTDIVAFGDSLTDTGNFFDLTGIPPEPYMMGRFSNGLVWIEYLAEELGMDIDSIVNYAVGGATTGRANENDIPGVAEFPGLQDEIDMFVDDLDGKKADWRALYVVWAGANDFFVSTAGPEETIGTGVRNTVIAVQRLYEAGARHIMVVNLPDLGLTPLGSESGNAAGLSYLTGLYNHSLDGALDQLVGLGIGTIRVDSAAIIQNIVASPGDFGLSNATGAYLATGGDPSSFLFWDAVHPTTRGHKVVAEEAVMILREEFRHPWGTPRNGSRHSHSSRAGNRGRRSH
jgi:phospholipase/lecithinase/hemolysin